MPQLNGFIDFSRVLNEKTSQNAFNQALKYIYQVEAQKPLKQSAKRKAHEFLTLIHDHLFQSQNPPMSKFYTLFILKLVTEKQERIILSVLTSHSLFKQLIRFAKQTDPFLAIEEKGKTIFEDEKLGKDFIRLVLESLKVWGQKYSSNKQQKDSHFKKAYDDLIKNGITMPTQLKFYNKKILQAAQGNRKNVSIPAQTTSKIQSEYKFSNNKRQQMKQQGQMGLMDEDIGKIKQFISALDGSDYEAQCEEYHKFFIKQKAKYQLLINQLIKSQDTKAIQKAISINQFYLQQTDAYNQFLAGKNKDYYSYVNLVQLKADELIVSISGNTQSKQLVRNEVKIEVSERKNNHISSTMDDTKEIVSELKLKLNEKSNQQTASFREIKESLSKSKSQGKFKRSLSGLKKSSVSRFGKSITKSRISPIFENPPNPYPQDKRYQGQLVEKNPELEAMMKNLTRNQGIRRFITSNFKFKNPLFENTQIQIGFKSEAIYEQVNEFRTILSIQLYIGNKIDDQLKNLTLEYKGQSDVLLYANPKIIKSYLEAGYQTKQELLVIPLSSRFSFIRLYLGYDLNRQHIEQKIIIPNSIIKLTDNSKLSKKQFVQEWNAAKIFKTREFKLTRYISPDSLVKYIPSLIQLSSYEQFLAPGSETDFELGCKVILMKKYEGVLRIHVRPSLNAIIQIGITDDVSEAHEGFLYYLQTLQTLLTHVDHQT